MKSTELLLILEVIRDVGLMCCTSIDKDITYVVSRVKNEGLSFLTITLPTFAKGIERCLEQRRFDPSLFRAFRKKSSDSAQIPTFLSGIVSKIFDANGDLRTDESIEAIDGIRQICLIFNKTKKECTDERKAQALLSYTKCEIDVASFRIAKFDALHDFDRVSRIVFGDIFHDLERELSNYELVPKHGPGAVVDRLKGNGKYRSLVWTHGLQRSFPSDMYLFCNAEEAYERREDLVLLRSKDVPPVKVIFVPKTQKTPRVIAIEPSYHQYCQQAIMASLVKKMEQHPLTKDSLHFTDSAINGRLAREASRHLRLATLDMSEASDRVHAALVHRLIRDYPLLVRAVFSCRSKYAKLPNDQVIGLKKFSSMGSALCFPFEAMVFYTLVLIGLHEQQSLSISKHSIKRIKRNVHVFGDDLIIPSNGVASVVRRLESVRLKVNSQKSFVSGYFRESCGVDAYKGHLVTPVYARTEPPTALVDAEGLSSWVATSNLFYKKGYWKTARYIRERILGSIFPFPHVLETSPLLGFYSFRGTYSVQGWDKLRSSYRVRSIALRVRKENDALVEYRRLLKFFLTRNELPSEIEDFNKSTLRGSANTKIRWSSPY